MNGLPAAYATARVASGNSQVDVTVFAYRFSDTQAYHFVTMVPAGTGALFNAMYGSMRRISDSEAAAVKPRKLVVVTARKGDTVKSLSARMAYTDAPLDRFLVLNGLSATSAIAEGQKVKLVTY